LVTHYKNEGPGISPSDVKIELPSSGSPTIPAPNFNVPPPPNFGGGESATPDSGTEPDATPPMPNFGTPPAKQDD